MRRLLILSTFLLVMAGGAGSASAIVVDPAAVADPRITAGPDGTPVIPYSEADRGNYVGVDLVPNAARLQKLAGTGVPTVTPPSYPNTCPDPIRWPDLSLPVHWPVPGAANSGLCWQGGPVLHSNESFVLTWDPGHRYWFETKSYLEQLLRDVADGSGTLSAPFSLTAQYADTSQTMSTSQHTPLLGPAANRSAYGGGCVDYGARGGSACQFGSTNGSGPGYDYPASSACDPSTAAVCRLSDADIRAELQRMIPQSGMIGRTQPGHEPLVVVLLPAGDQVCLDAARNLCSAGQNAPAQFCNYHSHVQVAGGTDVAYVVQPWTTGTGCDEPEIPALPDPATAHQVSVDAGYRIASPLSGGFVSAVVNPFLNGWYSNQAMEMDDNGCAPRGYKYDKVTVGASPQNPYLLQPEFNNGGVLQFDPNASPCWVGVTLSPTFVAPSAVNAGDVVQFDGSASIATLVVPRANYLWDFGDGPNGSPDQAVGPSVVHTYKTGGTYTVTLTVWDRGDDKATFSQTVLVNGSNGQPAGPPAPGPSAGLHVRLQLMPEALRTLLRRGLVLRLSSNETAAGVAYVSVSRQQARRAHLRLGRGRSVTIGRGTLSGIRKGTVTLHLRLSGTVVRRLSRLRHVTLSVRLALVGQRGEHLALDAAGHY